MKSLIYKIAILAFLLWSHTPLSAQQQRLHPDYEGWSRMTPTHIKAQYAGGMGFLSLGAGWDYGKRNQWETDCFIGFLPAKYADEFHTTFTLKQLYIPWDITLSRKLSLEPFSCGLYFNVISGERFWVKQPAKYPSAHYYDFSSRMRIHFCIGQRLRWNFDPESAMQSISLYYEVSANDLNIVSKLTNRELRLSDILFFSVGVKFQIQR